MKKKKGAFKWPKGKYQYICSFYFSNQCEPAYGRRIYSYLKFFFENLGFFFSLLIVGIKTSCGIIYKKKLENHLKGTQTYLYIYAYTQNDGHKISEQIVNMFSVLSVKIHW